MSVLVWFLVEQDGAVLTVHRKAAVPPFAGLWTLPGGAIEESESPSQAIARFGREELDIKVMGEEPVATLSLKDGGTEYAVEVYRVGFEGRPRYRESGPYSEVRWTIAAELPEPMPPALRALLADETAALRHERGVNTAG